MPLLELAGVVAGYGGITAIRGVSLSVEQGEIVSLIGANGAGKSTTLRVISGLVRARGGALTFDGKSLARLAPDAIVRLGISQVPEGRGVFGRLTVLENLQLGAYSRPRGDITGDLDRVFTLFPRLKERVRQDGGTLSGGEQQMLAIGRALMAHPRLLLLDEPSMGLSPILVETIFETIRQIREAGTPILLVEQNAVMALHLSDRAYVLESGEVALSGTGAELAGNPRVRQAYLGES